MQCFRNFPVVKKFMYKGGGGSIKIFLRKIFLSQCGKSSWGNPFAQCFRNFSVEKKFMGKGGGGVSRFSVEKFFSQSAEKYPRATRLCSVSEFFR